jgi:esterase/lipase superfamily enzyme
MGPFPDPSTAANRALFDHLVGLAISEDGNSTAQRNAYPNWVYRVILRSLHMSAGLTCFAASRSIFGAANVSMADAGRFSQWRVHKLHWLLMGITQSTKGGRLITAASDFGGLRTFRILVFALLCCSCVGRPLQGVLVPTDVSAAGSSRVPILVATTRQRATDDPGAMFNHQRAPTMSYAQLVVSIPPDEARQIGEIQWPVAPPGDPYRHFVTLSTELLDKRGFSAAIADVSKATGRSRAMIFIHGFNTRFDGATYRLAQIVRDSGAPVIPVLFSWPSLGVIGLRAYEYDRESANQSREALEQLLDTVALGQGVKEVVVLCHSMGCLLTLDALRSRSIHAGKIGAKITNVLLVAPDVDANVFREQMQEMGRARPRFALFLSQDDRALKLSRSLWGGGTRLGDVNPKEEPYRSDLEHERIIVFDLSHLGGRAHSRAFDEVTSVMGMIERRFAAGQQLGEEDSRTANASK